MATSRLRRRLDRYAAKVPIPQRHPFVLWALLFVCALTAPTAMGLLPLPGSLERLPALVGQFGAAAIFIGSLSVVIGQVMRNRLRGIAIEGGGLLLMMIGSGLYAYALFHSTAAAARALALAHAGGFAVGCFAYLIWIALYLRGRHLRSERPRIGT